MRQPFQVLIHPVRIDGTKWEYLLLRRIASRGGFWQGITGGVEGDESFMEAATRELFEEAGIVPSKIEQIEYSYSFPMQDEWRSIYDAGVENIVEHVFIAFVDGQKEPTISWEHDKWNWCSYNQALELLTWPNNIEALKCCDSFLRAWLDIR